MPCLAFMPSHLLPASAAAFAPRASSVNVVLGSKVEPWLTQTLKRINKIKRQLNSVSQHQRCLTETLSSPNAIWTLASIIVPKAPEADLRKDANPLIEAVYNYQMIFLEAYIVHVDMVLRNEVAYKLTPGRSRPSSTTTRRSTASTPRPTPTTGPRRSSSARSCTTTSSWHLTAVSCPPLLPHLGKLKPKTKAVCYSGDIFT